MKRILSIDFDYFIGTDIDTRNFKFPDGEDLTDVCDLWVNHYVKYPEIEEIGVTPTFDSFCEYLKTLTKGKVLISNSHRDIAFLFTLIENEELEVINIDFHHDNYITGGSKLDCANWVRHLMNVFPNTKFTWIKREDSEVASLFGDFPYPMTDDLNIEGEFDYIFICLSPEWTPPHLFPHYHKMCEAVNHLDIV